ncbi:MAG: ABC transporter substrate-binding protein [Proteobacteria bacterium]|nr:ABC transporter substrate-binding protein [Pseudomonadota bacterium]
MIATAGPAAGATAVKIGRTNVAKISHLPIYLALETGLFKQEGLDVTFVTMTERALVTAGLSGAIDFIPLPRAGAQAALKGAPVRFVVGQSLFSPSVLMATRHITSVAELRYRTLGFGQRGQAQYNDGENILRDRFDLFLGKDYQAVAIAGEIDRLAALERGEIQAGLFSFSYGAIAQARGFRRLLRTGTLLPRIEGAIWTTAAYLKTNRDIVRRFIRAVARATDIIHTDGRTTIAVIQKYFRMYDEEETKALWHSVRDIYFADIPASLLQDLFTGTRHRIEQKGSWPRGRKPPNAEYYIARRLLTRTLNQRTSALETIDAMAPTR